MYLAIMQGGTSCMMLQFRYQYTIVMLNNVIQGCHTEKYILYILSFISEPVALLTPQFFLICILGRKFKTEIATIVLPVSCGLIIVWA